MTYRHDAEWLEAWDEVRDTPCPRCGAKAGERCTNTLGTGELHAPCHPQRLQAAGEPIDSYPISDPVSAPDIDNGGSA